MITSPSMFGALRDRADNGVLDLVGIGGPLSGTSGTGVNVAGFGSTYTNLSNGLRYWNENLASSPYWTPLHFVHKGILGFHTDFIDGTGSALASTTASVTLASGLRIFGAGQAVSDSGLVVSFGADGAIARATSSATTNLPLALGFLGSTVPFDPATNGPLVVDADFTVITDLLTKRVFLGFVGTAADGLVSPVTGSSTTLTLVQDDVSGMMFDSGMTAATRIYAPHNKVDEAATIASSAAGVDTGVNVSAVTVYQRWRVEISPAGVMTCFINKAQVASINASASPTVDLAPVFLISGTSSAVDVMDLKRFSTWASRVS